MSIAQFKGAVRPVLAARSWPVWRTPGWLPVFITSVTVLYAAAIVVSASMTSFYPLQVVLFGFLLAGSIATVERTRKAGENAGVIKDMYGVWELPMAILLPPVYVLIALIPRQLMMQWRIRQIPLHRRVFSAAAVGLSYGAASVAFHAVNREISSLLPRAPSASLRPGPCSCAACGVLQWVINNGLVLTAVKRTEPTANVRELALASRAAA